MDLKSTPKLLVLIFFIGLLAIGLTSCKLPASSGPQTTSQTENFPVPGETQSGINVSTFATQTAQAAFPIVLNTPTPGQNPTNTPPGAIVNTPFNTPTLPVPAAPVPSSTPTVGPTTIQYVTATAGPPPSTYVLLAGEYPFCIARRFNVNQSELVELNNITSTSLFSAGDELKLPQTGNPFEGDRMLQEHPTDYKIKSGDTLGSIACYFGDVSPDMIALQNGLTTTTLTPGDVLVIP
jgi:LysM repeat protein